MPSKTDSAAAQGPEPDGFDNYFLEEFGDPFGSPEPEPAKNKRKEPEGLGIDEEVSVAKKPRVPRIKLDEDRLLSSNGVPELRRRARNLKLKGKGHEFSDASRLLSFYQLWLDDLFPKAKFVDALAMVEKAGHKTSMHKKRMEWINEGKPRPAGYSTPEPVDEAATAAAKEPTRIAPIFEKRGTGRPATSLDDEDPFADVDIYGASPGAGVPGDPRRKSAATGGGGGEPADDELDALIAEAEAAQAESTAAPRTSLFGSGKPQTGRPPPDAPGDDDLDALMAEAEAYQDEARAKAANPTRTPAATTADSVDDLDALIAEAEAAEAGPERLKPQPGRSPAAAEEAFAEEEAAMAEMDGLW